MMGPEIFNIYIEKLTNNISELTKSNILLSAQITYYEQQIAQLNNKIEELQQQSLDKEEVTSSVNVVSKTNNNNKKNDSDS